MLTVGFINWIDQFKIKTNFIRKNFPYKNLDTFVRIFHKYSESSQLNYYEKSFARLSGFFLQQIKFLPRRVILLLIKKWQEIYLRS